MYKKIAIAVLAAISVGAFAADRYDPSKSYPQGSEVTWGDGTFRAQWWANAGDGPDGIGPNPWESPWVQVNGAPPPGSDSEGDSGTSPPPPQEPNPPPQEPSSPPANGEYPQYQAGTKYQGGDIVSNDGKNYQCKPGITSGWCSGAAWAYEPGKGTAWQDAWTEYLASSDSDGNAGDSNQGGDNSGNTGESNQGENNQGGNDDTYSIRRSELNKKERDLTGFPLMEKVKDSIRTLPNGRVEEILALAPGNPENVKRVEIILPETLWNDLFSRRAPEYTYRGLLQAVGKFPALCQTYTDGRDSNAICRKTLATMFAHFAQETGGHNAYDTVPEWKQALVWVREMGWTEEARGGYNGECARTDLWQQQKWPCGTFPNGDFKSYFGRGAKQLSYNYNYGPFSEAMFDDVNVLLQNPTLVADTWLNLASAVFFYLYPQPPKPSMLFVIDGTWQPNDRDRENGLLPGFGVTTQIINGGVECGGSVEVAQSLNRIEYYKGFTNEFGVTIPSDEILGCKGMKQFDADGAGAINIYWIEDWSWKPDTPGNKSYACQLVGYQTAFSAFKQGDYAECVQYYFPNVEIIEDEL